MSQPPKTKISNVAVIGAGTMGAAIAQHFLMKNLNVILVDLQEDNLEKGFNNIKSSLQEAVERKILSNEKLSTLLSNLTCTTEYKKLQNTDFVVEAVFENKKVKQQVFQSIEANVTEQCIIASNTSSFSITELGSVINNKNRFLGVHYFYHAAKNKLIELIPSEHTAENTLQILSDFYYNIDKAPIIVADVAGFAVNRFFVPWLNEAVRLYEEGLGSIAFIDQVAVDVFKVGMGPFALMNATGVAITLHASQTLEEHFGSMYAPAQKLIEQIEKKQDWDLSSHESPNNNRQLVTERLLAMSLGIAAQMVSEGVTGISETDLGARLGLRWPIGPFELINHYGVNKTQAIIKQVFEHYQQGVPAIFSTIDAEQGFKIEHVKTHLVEQTALLEFNRPDAMNSLNPDVVACLAQAFEQVDNNPDIENIVFFGRGKAFVAGADIKFFVDHIKANTLQSIYQFASEGQALLNKIAGSKKQTIAYLDGLTLGGGLELALACDRRVASNRLVASFPETGIGIYPGLGGTQRSARILGKPAAKYLVATGAALNAQTALDVGLVSSIVPSSNNLEEISSLCIDRPENFQVNNSAQNALQVFTDFDGNLSSTQFENSGLEVYQKALMKKAPLALKKAMSLIDQGIELPLAQALQLELDGLVEIFASKDAYAGLSAALTGGKVSFSAE